MHKSGCSGPSLLPALALALASVLALPVQAFAQSQPDTTWKTVTPDGWRADLRLFADSAPHAHKNLFHTLTPAAFAAEVRRLDAEMSRQSWSPDEGLVAFMRLAAMVQDGHSGLDLDDLRLPQVPARFVEFDDGVYVTAAARPYASIVGGRLVRVGNTDWRTAIARLDSIQPHDPDNHGRQRTFAARYLLQIPTILHGIGGLSSSDTAATYTVEFGGKEQTITLPASVHPGPFSPRQYVLDQLPDAWVGASPSDAAASLARHNPGQVFWAELDREHRALYVCMRAVIDEDNRPLSRFADSLATLIASNDVGRVVLDLRDNVGGDNSILRPFLLTLIRAKTNYRGGLWVLISNKTFSAAQNLVNRLESYADPIFVGEPTGDNVNFYADVKLVTLPDTHLSIAMSALWWQDKDPRDARTATAPEIAVPVTFAQFQTGSDPALQIALSEPAPPLLEDIVRSAAPKGFEAVRSAYDAFERDPRHKYITDDERRMNRAGYSLLNDKQPAQAVVVFRVNADVHPSSSNAFDSLGEGLSDLGEIVAARAAYTKAVQLNPGNAHARWALDHLPKAKD
jgi:antitoxin (DNA-binding transcriptional repressor) of toxin-antitoxin stability system